MSHSDGASLTALLAITRAVHIGAALALFGALVFAIIIAYDADERNRRRIDRFALGCVIVAVVALAAWIALQAAKIAADFGETMSVELLSRVATHTLFGRLSIVRLVIAAMLFIAIVASRTRSVRVAATVLAGVFVASLSLAGHAAGGPSADADPRVIGDAVHLLAAGAWIGALPWLVLDIAVRARESERLQTTAPMIRRFSRVGLVSIAALLVTGTINALNLVGSLAALLGTDYGRLLMVKLALFAAMLALAAINRFHWTSGVVEGDARSARMLARSAFAELLLGVAVVVIAAVLGMTVPAVHADHTMHHGAPG